MFVAGMLLNVGLVPWYLTISNYNLIDKIWALVLPGALPIWNVIILMNDPDNYPLQTYIQQLVIANRTVLQGGGQAQLLARLSNNTLNAAKLFIAMIPILIVYPFLQNYFIRGIMLGAVKE